MNKIVYLKLEPVYKMLYVAFLGTGLLLSADYSFNLHWNHIAVLTGVGVFSFLMEWSGKKGIRIRLIGGLLLINIMVGLFCYKTEKEPELLFFYLGMEAACLAAALLCFMARNQLWLKALILAVQVYCLVWFGMWEIGMPKWEIVLILFCILLFLAETVDAARALYLFPILLLSSMLLLFLPVKEAPVSWEPVARMGREAADRFSRLSVEVSALLSGNGHLYSLSYAGYGSEGGLGGDLLPSGTKQVSVEGIKTKSPLYLSGSIYDVYTGRQWSRNSGAKPYGDYGYQLQYKELKNALEQSNFTQKDIQETVNYRSYVIKYEGLKTESLFCAPITQQFLLPEGTRFSKNKGDGIVLTKAQSVGFEYRMQFLEINYADERVKNLLRQRAWKESLEPGELLDTRRTFIYDRYTALPDTLPERVYTLAREITKDAKTDYDKLKAIEGYLNGFTYSREPGNCPEDRDFVDYFLFEKQEGYCTYFASAMAVLGRCVGIPTRYNEGFVTSATCNLDNVRIQLSGDDAHAWAEAYIEQVGWVPFEATPGYSEWMNEEWKQPETVQKADIEIPPDGAEESVSASHEEVTETNGETADKQKQELETMVGKGILTAAAGAAAIILLLSLRMAWRKRRYCVISNYEKVLTQMKKVFEFGKRYKEALRPDETLQAYGERLKGRLDTQEYTFAQLCKMLQEIRFGGRLVTEYELDIFEGYVRSLEKKYLQDCGYGGKILYYCYKLICA